MSKKITFNDVKEGKKLSNDEYEREIVENIVSIIKSRRNELGLSQRTLADISGVPQTTISRIERGAVVPSLQVLIRSTRYLKLKIKIESL